MFLVLSHTVSGLRAPSRLLDYALGRFDQLPSRNSVKKAIKRGELLLNGHQAEQGRWLQNGDTLELYDLEQKAPKHYELPIEIVYEDDFFAVVNKPAGIAVSGNQFRTVENALQGVVRLSSQPDALKWAKAVHRLDAPTSGLLLVAKTKLAHKALGLQFETRQIKKKYLAIVQGQTATTGTVDLPIGQQQALSGYQRMACVPSLQNGHLSLLKLSPETGRTHQLRIHMATLGHPIVGDKTYGTEGNIMKHKGLFLAAVELIFQHPQSGKPMQIQLDMPSKFTALLEREKRRWESFQQNIQEK